MDLKKAGGNRRNTIKKYDLQEMIAQVNNEEIATEIQVLSNEVPDNDHRTKGLGLATPKIY